MISAKEAKSHSKAKLKAKQERIFEERAKQRKLDETWAKNNFESYLKEAEKEIRIAVKNAYESTSIRLPGEDHDQGTLLLASKLSNELRKHGYKTSYNYYRTHDIDYPDDHWTFEIYWGEENG